MKRTLLFVGLFLSALLSSASLNAQTQKGYMLVGSDISNFDVNWQSNNMVFNWIVNPKAAWFIKPNLAVGGFITFGLTTTNDNLVSSVVYALGPLARYYFNSTDPNLMKRSCFFVEANAGFSGQAVKLRDVDETVNTNGLGLGIGPGWTYFITKNVGIEALLKYDVTIGFGDATTINRLNFNLGFQIYLPGKKLKMQMKEAMDRGAVPSSE